jgi:hypothetical protein
MSHLNTAFALGASSAIAVFEKQAFIEHPKETAVGGALGYGAGQLANRLIGGAGRKSSLIPALSATVGGLYGYEHGRRTDPTMKERWQSLVDPHYSKYTPLTDDKSVVERIRQAVR